MPLFEPGIQGGLGFWVGVQGGDKGLEVRVCSGGVHNTKGETHRQRERERETDRQRETDR